jgi:hypothetical protein
VRRPLNKAGLAILTLAILAVGFLAGRAIGNANPDEAEFGSTPTGVTTRAGAVAVPTLGGAGEVPPLQSTTPPAEPEESEEGENSAPTPEEGAEAEPAPTPESGPEVTVAPNR